MEEPPTLAGITRAIVRRMSCGCAGTVQVEHTLARLGAEKLWRFMHEKPFVNALGALTGNQAMQTGQGWP